jgi:hypothetical protein
MVIPSTALGIVFLLVLVIPGTVYASVRTTVGGRGPHDSEIGTRVLQAVIASVLLNSAYLLVFGDWLIELFTRDGVTERPRVAGATALALGVLVPALLAYVIHGKPRIRRGFGRVSWLPWPRTTTGYETTPTAWDWAVQRRGGRWIRIRVTEGRWIGGWFSGRSFVSTYPEPRDIFIAEQHTMTPEGSFGPAVEDSAGVWLTVNDGYIVEWINPDIEPSSEKD